MRTTLVAFGLVLAAGGFAFAQQPPTAQNPAAAAAMKLFASSSDVTALMANAKRDRKPDQATVSQRIVALAPFVVNLEYRPAVSTASVHEHEAELFYVIDGSATAVTGGKLVNERRTNAENLTGTAVEGGTSQRLAKGHFLLVPAGVPHWFTDVNEYFQFSLHLPIPAATGR